MTDLDLYTGLPKAPPDPTGGRLVAWAQAGHAAWQIAEAIAPTAFVPEHFRGKPKEVMAALMLADELGLPPVSGLRSIYVIKGTPSMYAKAMVGLVMAHGHQVWTESSTAQKVVVSGQRQGSEHIETIEWSMERARTAGYTSNNRYATNPQEMLYAKAAAEVCRKIAPDVLAGVPFSVEDLELDEPQPTTPLKRAASRIQRAPRISPVPAEPEFDEPEQPAQEPVKATAERDNAGITAAQSKALHASLRDAKLADRDAGLAYIGDILGREITTTKDLSKADASFVIDSLKREAEAPPPETPEPGFDFPEGGAQ